MPTPILPIPGSGPGTTGPITPEPPITETAPPPKPPRSGKPPHDGDKTLPTLLQQRVLEYVPVFRRAISI